MNRDTSMRPDETARLLISDAVDQMIEDAGGRQETRGSALVGLALSIGGGGGGCASAGSLDPARPYNPRDRF